MLQISRQIQTGGHPAVLLDAFLQFGLMCRKMVVYKEKRCAEHPEAYGHGSFGSNEIGRRVDELAEQRIVFRYGNVPDEISSHEQREMQNTVGGFVKKNMRRSNSGL